MCVPERPEGGRAPALPPFSKLECAKVGFSSLKLIQVLIVRDKAGAHWVGSGLIQHVGDRMTSDLPPYRLRLVKV